MSCENSRATGLTVPLVTVLVNTFNHERFITQALTSVAEQYFPAKELEIIVVDDGSKDLTPEIVQRFLPRICFIRKCNGGQVSTLHQGMVHATGEIIAFLDGDDWWTADKITKVVEAFQRYPNIAAVGHGYHEVDEQGVLTGTMALETESYLNCKTAQNARLAANLRVFGGTSRLAIRRKALESMLPVPSTLAFFDNFIFTQAIALSGAVILPDPLCYYRLHSANLYASNSLDNERLRRRHNLLCNLLEHLPARLSRLGLSDDIIAATLDSDRMDAARLGLVLDGGSPWQTFCIERSAFHNAYRNPDIGYRVFKCLVLLLALLTPPKTFYHLQRWYAKHNLGRIRQRIGGAALAVPEIKTKPPGKRVA